MTIYVRDVVEVEFINMIPLFITKVIKDNSKGIRYRKMNKYLKENYNVTIEDIISQLKFKIYKYSNLFCIQIDKLKKERTSQLKIVSLVKLIDFGSNDIKGINLVESSMDYISKNIMNIYRAIQLKGEN